MMMNTNEANTSPFRAPAPAHTGGFTSAPRSFRPAAA